MISQVDGEVGVYCVSQRIPVLHGVAGKKGATHNDTASRSAESAPSKSPNSACRIPCEVSDRARPSKEDVVLVGQVAVVGDGLIDGGQRVLAPAQRRQRRTGCSATPLDGLGLALVHDLAPSGAHARVSRPSRDRPSVVSVTSPGGPDGWAQGTVRRIEGHRSAIPRAILGIFGARGVQWRERLTKVHTAGCGLTPGEQRGRRWSNNR